MPFGEKKSAATKLASDAYRFFLCEKIDSTVIVNFTLSWEIYSCEAKFEFVLLCLSCSEKINNILKKMLSTDTLRISVWFGMFIF